MVKSQKVWLIGADSFTGFYLIQALHRAGCEVDITEVDITQAKHVEKAMLTIKPSYVINLAAISFVPDGNNAAIYAVNTLGVQNILDACLKLSSTPTKILLVSSSTIYGQQQQQEIAENCQPNPINHYGCSKWAMEQIAKTYSDQLNIVITRPFNYTGKRQAAKFLVPKIVAHFQRKAKKIQLGNIDVWRDFSDVRWVADTYVSLLRTSKVISDPVNICSGTLISIREVITLLGQFTGHTINVEVNPDFIRKSDIKSQKGDNKLLYQLLPELSKPMDLEYTLQWMLQNTLDENLVIES